MARPVCSICSELLQCSRDGLTQHFEQSMLNVNISVDEAKCGYCSDLMLPFFSCDVFQLVLLRARLLRLNSSQASLARRPHRQRGRPPWPRRCHQLFRRVPVRCVECGGFAQSDGAICRNTRNSKARMGAAHIYRDDLSHTVHTPKARR